MNEVPLYELARAHIFYSVLDPCAKKNAFLGDQGNRLPPERDEARKAIPALPPTR